MRSIVPGGGDARKEVVVREPGVFEMERVGFWDGGGEVDHQGGVI